MKRNDISQSLKNYVNAVVNRAEKNIVNFSAESKMSGSVSDGVTKIYPNTNTKTLICESIDDNEYRTITLNPCDGSITLKNGTVSGISDVSGEDPTVALSQRALIKLQGDLDQKADKIHTHSISDVNNLQTSLDNKADMNHTHTSFNNDISINGNIIFPNSGTTTREIKFTAGSNDYGRLAVGATSKDNGWLELATTDNGNEPIYMRQYYGSNIKHEAVLLDANGNTSFPGTVTSPNITSMQTSIGTINSNITTLTETSEQHSNAIASINSTLNDKANVNHTHSISDVNNLQASLDNKADKNHTHTSFNNDININGNISFNESGTTTREIKFKVGSDDFARVAVGAPSRDNAWLEIATSDNGNEPIYVRQYNNPRQEFATIKHEAVLLDANGNTSFPGTITSPNITSMQTSIGNINSNITTLTETSEQHSNAISTINSTLNGKANKTDLDNKVDKTKVTTYFRTATRSQRWGLTTKYGYDNLGYIKAVNRIYTSIAGLIKVSVTTTNNLNEVFEVSVSYGCGSSVNSNFKLTGNSSISNDGGKTAIALNPVDESKTAYSIAIVVDGYTNNDSCGYSVVMLMPEMLKLYSNAECTQELPTSNYNTNQGNYGFGTINKDSLTYSNIYWNEETRALKVDVNNLQTSLNNKADKNHTHTRFDNNININGNIIFPNSGTNTREIKFKVGSDDNARIAVGATGKDKGWLEIATSDGGNEPIYVRQYNNPWKEFVTVAHEAVLLDANGNTSFPGTVTTPNINAPNKADKNHTHTLNDITGVVKNVSVQYEYKVSDLTLLSNPVNWGHADSISGDYQPTWQTIDKHTIKITFYQNSQVKPNLRIVVDNAEETVAHNIEYNLNNNSWHNVIDYRGYLWYENTATIDLSPISFIGNYGIYNICRFSFEQDGTYYTTGSFYVYKNKTANITKPDTSQLATMQALIDLIYPVGSLYTSFNNINPGYFLGGTWEQIVDRFLYCANNSKQTGGSKKITVENLPPHSHSITTAQDAIGDPDGAADTAPNRYNYWRGVKSFDTGKTGSGTDYMPPYLSIYAWFRTN